MEEGRVKKGIGLAFLVVGAIVLWSFLLWKCDPLWEMSQYNHSTLDDIWMSVDVHLTWEETHSILSTLGAAWNVGVTSYVGHDGCFLSMCLTSLMPGVFSENYYSFTYYFHVVFFGLCILLCLYSVSRNLLELSGIWVWVLSPVVLLLAFTMTPSISDAYYWWAGAINYTFFTGIFLLEIALLAYDHKKKSLWSKVCIAFLAFILSLGNLLTALGNFMVLGLGMVSELWGIYQSRGNEKISLKTIIHSLRFSLYWFMATLSLGINMLAPGNLHRGGEDLFSHSILGAIGTTIKDSTSFYSYFYRTAMGPWMLMLCLGCILAMVCGKSEKKYSHPLVFGLLCYLIYCGVFTPVVYSGSSYYWRCLNISYFFWLMQLVATSLYLGGWLKGWLLKVRLLSRGKQCLGVCFTLAFFLSLGVSFLHPESFDTNYAKLSLESGEAQAFDEQLDARFALYENPNISVVEISPIYGIPYIFEFSEDMLDVLCDYYGKEEIILREE
ncbi:MAG: DUF6056 family protein [Lachnospiraceae bacterium]|nr:DUF6056 family protein [Lachnospiraceae bacterium]